MSLAAEFVARYSRPPSPTTVSRAVSLHQGVRELLGDAEYATFLQGSYKNDTALWDMNDVDIVAMARGVRSSVFTGSVPVSVVTWDEIFARIERKLQADPRYQGKWKREDKCIRLNTGVKIDIVPAVYVWRPDEDPIALYSFADRAERRNWPRGHYDAGTSKSGRTSGAYKQTVRMFKRWAKSWFGSRKVAPSYYLECAVHAQPDGAFTGDVERDFCAVGLGLLQLSYPVSTLPRLAGEGNLLTASEWDAGRFGEFQRTLQAALPYAVQAQAAHTEQRAREMWTAAFNGQVPT
jgi:hypothetical protein